ncbi:MAG: flagellar biosynthetic protein FliO, partial [Phycisphaerales bacterium]|nr:flagellar biosynthetic protein FliO [Phycisphaerales bacterium]
MMMTRRARTVMAVVVGAGAFVLVTAVASAGEERRVGGFDVRDAKSVRWLMGEGLEPGIGYAFTGVSELRGLGGGVAAGTNQGSVVKSVAAEKERAALVGVRAADEQGVGSAGAGGGGSAGGLATLSSMALPLGVVLVVLVGCMMLLKRVMGAGSSLASALGPGGKAPGGVIEVLGRYPVAKGQLLVLVKVDRRVLLLGHSSPGRGGVAGGGGFVTLSEINEPEEVARLLQKIEDGGGTSLASKFGSMLRKHSDEHGDGVERVVGETESEREREREREREDDDEVDSLSFVRSSGLRSG